MRRNTLLDLFDDRIRSDRPFIVHDGGYRSVTWSYADIRRAAFTCAERLRLAGGAPGDRVVLWGENRAEWIVAFWGCLLARAVVVPMDPRTSPTLVGRVARIVDARIVFTGADLRPPPLDGIDVRAFDELLASGRPETAAAAPELPDGSDSRPRAGPGPEGGDLAEIIFTSGATADPKGVRITHANVLANIVPVEREIRKYARYGRPFFPLRFLNLLPLSHMFGQAMATFIPPLLEGVTVFMRGYNPADIVRQIRTRRVSVLVCVPKILEVLRDHVLHVAPEAATAPDSPEPVWRRWWRYRRVHRLFGFKFWSFVVGAAPLDPEVEAFWSRLGFLVIQGYGLTETAPIVTLNHPFRTRRGSVGRPIAGIEVRIADDGEILVRGGNVTSGYYNAPEATAAAFRDGWFHTGDVGALDADGRLHVHGRKKEMIVTPDGRNVFPDDVERAVAEIDGVRDVGVVAGGTAGGEHVHAVLLLAPGTGPEAVVRRANATLEDHQRIRAFSVWPGPALPRTDGTRKLKRGELRRWVAGGERTAADEQAADGRTVADVLSRFAPGRTITGATTLEEIGLSSLERIELALALERRFDCTVDETALAPSATVDELQARLAGASPGAADSPAGAVAVAAAPEADITLPAWSQHPAARAFRRLALAAFLMPLTRMFAWVRVEGRERLDGARGPVLYAANHQSVMDGPVILAALPAARRHLVATAAAREWFAPHFRPAGHSRGRRIGAALAYYLGALCFNVVPLPQREAGARAAMRHLGTLLGEGSSVLIFPEGRRRETGQIDTFQPGVAMLAAQVRAPIVPVRIDGVDRVLPVGARWARPGPVRVAFGDPIEADGGDHAEIARRIERAVRTL